MLKPLLLSNCLPFSLAGHSGIVEDVFLIGAPVSGDANDWCNFSSVVAGQITNAYCKCVFIIIKLSIEQCLTQTSKPKI